MVSILKSYGHLYNELIYIVFVGNMSIYLSTVVNLTLIDLPGLTKVAVGNILFLWNALLFFISLLYLLNSSCPNLKMFSIEGQPESIVADIENMVRLYVEKVFGTLLIFRKLICASMLSFPSQC